VAPETFLLSGVSLSTAECWSRGGGVRGGPTRFEDADARPRRLGGMIVEVQHPDIDGTRHNTRAVLGNPRTTRYANGHVPTRGIGYQR
jgi:hypothetical protein